MDSVREFTCINCPIGCRLTVSRDGEELKVTGNTCPRGEKYAIQELTDPRRTVTSSVAVLGGIEPVTAVRTTQPVPKADITAVLGAIHALRAPAPLLTGQVLLRNVCGTGADVAVTRAVAARE